MTCLTCALKRLLHARAGELQATQGYNSRPIAFHTRAVALYWYNLHVLALNTSFWYRIFSGCIVQGGFLLKMSRDAYPSNSIGRSGVRGTNWYLQQPTTTVMVTLHTAPAGHASFDGSFTHPTSALRLARQQAFFASGLTLCQTAEQAWYMRLTWARSRPISWSRQPWYAFAPTKTWM